MFGYHGDDLAVFLACITLAVPFVRDGLKSDGWERWATWTVAGSFIAFGLAWDRVKASAPHLAAIISGLATSAQTWFVFAMLALAWFFYSRDKSHRTKTSRYDLAGYTAVALAGELRETNPFMQGPDPTARINSEIVRLRNMGIEVPQFPPDMGVDERRGKMAEYLDNVGTMLADGHISEAKQVARMLCEKIKRR